MSRTCSPAFPSRACTVGRLAADFADGAGNGPSGLVVMILDDDGLLAAVRQADECADFGPADIEEACATLLDLSPPAGPGAAAVVSINFGIGVDAAAPAWRRMRRRFEHEGITLVDWLVVEGESTTALAEFS